MAETDVSAHWNGPKFTGPFLFFKQNGTPDEERENFFVIIFCCFAKGKR